MISQIYLTNGVNNNPFIQRQHPRLHQPSKTSQGINIEDPRVVQRLVNNLIYLFSIPSGDQLTFILGQGPCTQNQEALKCWVLQQLADEPVDQNDVLKYLVEHLKRQMNQEVYS